MDKEKFEKLQSLDFKIKQLQIQIDYITKQLEKTKNENAEFVYYLESHEVHLKIGKEEIRNYLVGLVFELATLKVQFENQ